MAAETPTARYVIEFPADTSGIEKANASLDALEASITRDNRALLEMNATMQRLRGTADVVRWEALPRDIAKSENEVKRLSDKMAKLKADFAAAPDSKKEGIFAAGLKTSQELQNATKRLSGFKDEQAKLRGSEPVKLFEDLRLGADRLKQKLGESQTAFSRLGGVMGKSGAEAGTGLGDLAAGAEAAGLPVGGLMSKFKSLAALGPAAMITAAVVAVVALAAAFAAAVIKATAFAIATSDAVRSVRLLREASATGKASADAIAGAILRIEEKSSSQREEIAGLVNEYAKLGLSLGAIESATGAVSIATQTMGASVGSTIKGLIDRGIDTKRFWLGAFDLKGTGLAINDVAKQLAAQMKIGIGAAATALRQGTVKLEDGVKALNAAVEAKFGELAKKQLLALPVQFDRAKKNIAALFGGLNIDPFLEKLAGPLELLKETNEVGSALKHALTALFQPLTDSAGDSMPILEGFIYGATIAIQKLVIGALTAAAWLKKTFGGSALLKDVDALSVGLWLGEAALTAFVVVVVILGTAAATAIGILAAIPTVLTTIGSAFISAGMAIWNGIVGAIKLISEKGPGAALEAAGNIVRGLVDGIIEGIPRVAQAFVSLAKGGIKALKGALGIASPAKAIKAEAKWIGPGVVEAVEESKPAVAKSLSTLVDPESVNAPAGGGKFGRSSAGSEPNQFNVTLNYNGSGSRSDAIQFKEWIADELEIQLLAKGVLP